MIFFPQFAIFCLLAVANAQNTVVSPTPEPTCDLQAVCYALDQSSSIDSAEYSILTNFTVTTARLLNGNNPMTTFAAVRFSTSSSVIQGSTANVDGVFVPAVVNAVPSGGGTNIFSGVRECFNELQKSPPEGGRLIIVVTDGQGAFGSDPIPDIRAAGIGVITVGVGNGINVNFLRQIATTPDLFIPASFTNIVSLSQTVVSVACTPLGPAPDNCALAFDRCEFSFQNTTGLSTFNASGLPDTPFTPLIVSKNSSERIGVANMNNLIPQFIVEMGAKNITEFAQQPFSPTQFKPYSNSTGSAIGHETYQGNQSAEARGRCIRVYFSSFQILDATGNVIINADNVPKSENKCVVFNTSA